MFKLWCILNTWLLFSSTYASNDKWQKNIKEIPKIFFGTIDGDTALLAHLERCNGDNCYSDWSNLNIVKKQSVWIGPGNRCRMEYNWPSALTLQEPASIPTIPEDIFRVLPVKHFCMKNLNLQSVSKEDFKNGFYLESVDLSNNSVVSVPSFLFSHTPEINQIDLSNNAIDFIADDAFEKDPYVNVTEFQKECSDRGYETKKHFLKGNLYKLRILNLANNRLDMVNPKWFESLENLYEVSLAFNKIKVIDATAVFSRNTILNDVDLGNNQIEDITTLERDNLIKPISIITISNNPVKNPSGLYATAFYSYMRNIKDDSDTIITISPHVTRLDASNNHITSIIAENPPGLLTVLKLNKNKLTSISNLTAFLYLEELYLAENVLTNFESAVFEKFEYLYLLDLSYNKLKHFELTIPMLNLRELRLAGNGLTILDTNLKSKAQRLDKIGLADNDWNCEYLTSVVLLLLSDQIYPIRNDPTDVPESYAHIKYDDNVKGVNCFNDVESTTALPDENDAKISRELMYEVQQMLDEKLSKLQEKLIEMLQKTGKK